MPKFAIALSLGLISLATNVWADDDGSYANYDNIVNELKAAAEDQPVVPTPPADDYGWDQVAIHGGVALATSWTSITSPSGVHGEGLLTGVELGFGINLFSKHWRAEGAFGSYSQGSLDSNMKAELREFGLQVIYLPVVQDNMSLRLGAGLGARYMSLNAESEGRWTNFESNTPNSVFLIGFERKLTKSITLGPDVSYHSALVSDTFDRSAWDASLRLNASF